jgi:hypothetical protein
VTRSAVVRRDALLKWLRERPEHQELTAGEIADVSGLYDELRDGAAAALADLRALGRSVTWEAVLRNVGGVKAARVWRPSEETRP